jgi:hypothetical protein
MPIPLLAIAAASQIPKAIAGISQLSKANKALKALGQQAYPEYSVSPEMQSAYNRAQAMSKYGFSPEEKAQMQQEQARNQTAALRAARDEGGAYYDTNVDFVNKAAAQGAGLRRQNIQYADSLAQSLQEQKNRQTGSMIARRQMLEQAYGQAKSSAISNITGAAASVGAMGAQSAMGAASNKAMIEAARMGQPGTTTVDETIVDTPNEELINYDYSQNPDN